METTLQEILVVLGALLLLLVESLDSGFEKIWAFNFLELTIAEISASLLLLGAVMVVLKFVFRNH